MSYLCNVEKIRDTLDMRIFTEQVLKEYIAVRPEVKTALQEWVMIVKQSQWTCFADIKATFNSVDSIGNQRYVFNIKGNKYRLVDGDKIYNKVCLYKVYRDAYRIRQNRLFDY